MKKKTHQLFLPYQGDKGCNIIKSMNKCVNKLLPNNTKVEVVFKSTKLSSCFNVKNKIDFEHNHDLIYHSKCPEPTCIDDYVREIAPQITERIKDHNGRDHTSHVLEHSIEKSYKNVNTIDFKVKLLIRIFIIIIKKRKIAEVLWVNDQDQHLTRKRNLFSLNYLIDL